jgi:hypothetical protein
VVLDEDMDQYIHDNTDDEISHHTIAEVLFRPEEAGKGADRGARPLGLAPS